MGTERASILSARGIGKRFFGVAALSEVDLELHPAEVVAVVGENGAGKSTLMKILAGVQRPDAGSLLVDGRTVEFGSVRDAAAAGIALIHQELELCENLDVAGNLLLGREPRRGLWLDRREEIRLAKTALDQVGLRIDPSTPLAELSLGQRQLVEIAKALSMHARILVMDEPTSSLSLVETERLLGSVRELRQRGTTVVYISHRLGEVTAIADRVVVLRDGRNAGELRRDEISHDAMVRCMVGRDLGDRHRPQPRSRDAAARLSVRGLRTSAWPTERIDLTVAAGEIVGLAGLVGAGRSEVLRAVFGADGRVEGEVAVDGRAVASGSIRAAVAAGIAFVPEDRKADGLILDEGIRDNVALPVLATKARSLWRRERTEAELAAATTRELSIKAANDSTPVRTLSGGNQQKVVIGKWLTASPKVLLLDEPTRGIDVGSKAEIYALLRGLAANGVAILFASSEMEEVLTLAERIVVLCEGRLSGELSSDGADEESVLRLATAHSGHRKSAARVVNS
ncbi:MAG: sugar ABC transporter ATP-binding protein [Planctomycetota bacterium]